MLLSLQRFFAQQGEGRTYWIAYSGGLDSHVLLKLCHEVRRQMSIVIRAIHVNHGLNPKAQEWADHCRRQCETYDIELVVRKVQITLASGDSLEEVAREKRYEQFASCMQADDILLTAHQQDDQAETLLLQLLRGAGIKGMSAMPSVKRFASGHHARPLLNFSRKTLQHYANENHLQWVEDDSNSNCKLTRNFIRHDVLTLLESRFPSAAALFARAASHCAEAQALLDEVAKDWMSEVQGSREHTLSVAKLLSFSEAKQRLLLRYWINDLGYLLPDRKKINTICHDVLHAAWDKMPCVEWDDVVVRRYRDDLYLTRDMSLHDASYQTEWELTQALSIPSLGQLKVNTFNGQGLRATIQKVSVRFRQLGEVVNVAGRGKHAIKNLLQEWGIPPWERERVPLLFLNNELIAAVGYYVSKEYAAREEEKGLVITLVT